MYSPQLCFWRSLDTNLIWPAFLYYWMYGREFFVQYKGVAGQTDMAEYVSLTDQRRMHITLPEIDDQRGIAHILGTLDDKIELNRRTNETLEAMARALFKSWFVDFDPVRAKAQGQTPPGMDPATAALFPIELEDSELGEIPKGWRVAPLNEWVDALSGGTPSKKNAGYWAGDIPWISPKVMTTIHADRAEHYVTEAAIGNGTRLAPAGATLVMVRGMGLHREVRVSQALRDVTFNQDVKALVATHIEPTLLLYALLDAQQVLLGRVESSGHGTGRLPSDVLLSYPLVMPDESAQHALARPFSEINQRIASLRGESKTLARIRDALLPRLLSGELSVARAEQAVGGHGMRITRVTKIRGHRVFRDFAWPGALHCFAQFNLIYGWNGCGKTTLSSLFAHLEKRTNLTEGEVEFEIDEARKCSGTTIAGTNLPDVRVFNRDFINATITAAGERVEPIYYLGEDSIEKQAEADERKKEKETALEELTKATSAKESADGQLNRFCVDRAKVIKELLTGSQSAQYNNYDKRRFRQSIAAMQAQTDAQAALLADDEKEQLRKQKDSQPKSDLLAVACTPPDFAQLANEAKGLLDQAVASETLDALAQDKALAGWVQQGLALHSADRETITCHFCSQSLTAERRAALEGHFNDAFAAFQQELSSAIAALERETANLNGLTFPDAARAYDHLQGELATATSEAHSAIESTVEWLTEVRNALDAKKAAPFAASHPGTWQDEVPTSDVVRDAIAAVNAVIAKHNHITSDFRNKVDEACKKLEQHYVAEAWDEQARLAAAVKDAEAALKPLQDEVTRLQTEIADIERDIIEHRKPADELNDELRAYLGRDELRFEVKETGYALTRSGQPVSHLSEGERTAIAFLYFLKSLQDRAFDLADGVVVIDDPVSSLDANALFSAFGYMKERTKACGQLFVLTHNFGFFREVRNWFQFLPNQKKKPERRPARFFLLSANSDAAGERVARIGPLDPLLENYESEYHYLFRRVYDEAKRADGDSSLEHHYSMPNIARRLIESFLAFRYPDCPGSLQKRLERVEFSGGRKTRIQSFLNTYSHTAGIGVAEHDPSVLAETKAVLGELLEMIQSVDPIHYAGMEQLVNRKEASA